MEAKLTAANGSFRTWRQSGAPSRGIARVARIAVASVVGVSIIAMGLTLNAAAQLYESEFANNEFQLKDLAATIAEMNRHADDVASGDPAVDVAGEDLDAQLAAAQVRANELAQAQQEFVVIAFAGNTEVSAGAGVPDASGRKTVEQRKALVDFFAPSALVLPDDLIYSPVGGGDDMDAGTIDPRMAWFIKYNADRTVADPAGSVWVTGAVAPSTTPGISDVIWLNKNPATDDLYAWASGEYSHETNTFNSVRVTLTSYGSAARQSPVLAGDGSSTEVD
jgi:hypothetical protein